MNFDETKVVKISMTETVHHEWTVEIPTDLDNDSAFQYAMDQGEIDFSNGDVGESKIDVEEVK